MKISNLRFFEQRTSELMAGNQRLADIQAQVASGKRVNAPSDAPQLTARVQDAESVLARQDAYLRSLDSVQRKLELQETQMRSASDVLLRVRELAVQAANDTNDSTARKAIATELRTLTDFMQSLANTRDESGNHVFGGSATGQPPFERGEDGRVAYQGDATRVEVEIGPGRLMVLYRSGTEVFAPLVDPQDDAQRVGFFDALGQLADDVEAGNQAGMQQGLANLDSLEESISLALGEIGGRMNIVDRQRDVVETEQLRMREVLSELVDLDYAEAITRLRREELALEAAQGTLARISRLSLFNFID